MDIFNLSGKVAVVTGAAKGGLGSAMAVALAEAGARVAVTYHKAKVGDLNSTVAAIEAVGQPCMPLQFDVVNEAAVSAAMDKIVDNWGGLDIAVSNAGILGIKSTLEMTLEEWQQVIDVNLTGTWLLDKHAGRHMVARRSGKIINISSQVAKIVRETPHAPYYASKSGLLNLTRALAAEWGRFGINVNCIAPGYFYPTGMTKSASPEHVEVGIKRSMLGRVGDPERDLKGAVVFLASAASDYVTGHILYVDGGWTAW